MTSRHGYGIDQGSDGNAYGTWGGEAVDMRDASLHAFADT
jgi:hypothetical protein